MAELKIKVSSTGIDKTEKDLKKLDTQTEKFNKNAKATTSITEKLSKNIGKVTVAVVGAYTAYKTLSIVTDKVIKSGLEYNKVIEEQTQGLKSLIVATSKNVDSQGKALTITEKYTLANKEATQTLKELTALNAQTPQSLSETVQIYKTLLPAFKQSGASQKDLLKITKSLAVASKSAGIQFQSLLAGVDGLGSGTVLVNSDLGRFLNNIGLTNKALKESKDVTKLVVEQLKPFDVQLDTLAVAQSNLGVAWDTLTGKLTQDIFVAQKQSLKEVTTLLNTLISNEGQINGIRDVINGVGVGLVNLVAGLAKTVNNINIGITAIKTGLSGFSQLSRKIALESQLVFQEAFLAVNETLREVFGEKISDKMGLKDLKNDTSIDELKDKLIFLNSETQETVTNWNGFLESSLLINETIDETANIVTKNILKPIVQIKKEEQKTGKLVSKTKVEYEGVAKAVKDYDDALADTNSQLEEMTNIHLRSLESGFTTFFDRQSDNFRDFGALGKSIINDIQNQLIKQQLIKPLTSALGGVTSSIFDGAIDSAFDFLGFAEGGYTGKGGKKEVAGVVHKGEYVVPQHLVSGNRNVIAGLEAQRQGKKGFDVGGFAGGDVGSSFNPSTGNYGGYGGEGGGDGGLTDYGQRLRDQRAREEEAEREAERQLKARVAQGGINDYNDFLKLSPANQATFLSFSKTSTGGSNAGDKKEGESGFLGRLLGGIGGFALTAVNPLVGVFGGKLIERLVSGTEVDKAVTQSTKEFIDSIQKSFTGSFSFDSQNITNVSDRLSQYGGDGGGGSTGGPRTSSQVVAQVQNNIKAVSEAYKNDAIALTTQLYEVVFGELPKVTNNITKDWVKLLQDYNKDGSKALIETVLTRGSGALFGGKGETNLFPLWKEYAESINTDILTAIAGEKDKFKQTSRSVQLAGGSSARLSAQFAKEDLNATAERLGINIADVTADNFSETYKKAIQENFTPETFQKWETLADSFISATNAQEAYNNQLNRTQQVIDELTAGSGSGDGSFQQLSKFNRLKSEYAETGKDSTFNELLSLSGVLGKDERFRTSILGFLSSSMQGFATGGYTGAGGKYDVAGLVHKGEYVVNQDQLRGAGGVAGVENMLSGGNSVMTGEMTAMRGQNRTLLKEIQGLHKLFRDLTDGGYAMKSELIA